MGDRGEALGGLPNPRLSFLLPTTIAIGSQAARAVDGADVGLRRGVNPKSEAAKSERRPKSEFSKRVGTHGSNAHFLDRGSPP
jgi:hypothetical protein